MDTIQTLIETMANMAKRIRRLEAVDYAAVIGTHTLLSATHGDVVAGTPSLGAVIAGDATTWGKLTVGADGTVLTADAASARGVKWAAPTVAVAHDVLSLTHTDTLASAVSQGSLIVGNATPKWAELVKGGAGAVLTGDGTDTLWSTYFITSANAATLALAITAGKTLTLTATNDYNMTVPATGTVAMLTVANVFTVGQMVDNTADTVSLRLQSSAAAVSNFLNCEDSGVGVVGGFDKWGRVFSYGNSGVTTNFFASHSGNNTLTGTHNMAMGSSAASGLTTGYDNIAIGSYSGRYWTTDNQNVSIGYQSSENHKTGCVGNVAVGTSAARGFNAYSINLTSIVAVGHEAMYAITSNIVGSVGVGYQTLYNLAGSYVTAIGYQAGYNNSIGERSIYIGAYAGYRQTTLTDILIIDNQQRANAATELSNAIIYGVMDADMADQTLRFNAGSMGFYGHAVAAQPTKAGHNNWANLSDVVQALVDIGIFDAV